MKSRMLSLFVLAFSLFFTSCADDSPTANSTPNGSMSAKINGSAWSPGTLQPVNVGGMLTIVGIEINGATNRQINITITGAAVGEYTLGGINGGVGRTLSYAEGTGTTTGGTAKTYSATSGTVKITELSATGAKGTFSATVEGTSGTTGTHTITDGSFDVKF